MPPDTVTALYSLAFSDYHVMSLSTSYIDCYLCKRVKEFALSHVCLKQGVTLRNWLCSGCAMNRPPEQAISFVDYSLVFDTLVNDVLRDKFMPDDPLSPLMA